MGLKARGEGNSSGSNDGYGMARGSVEQLSEILGSREKAEELLDDLKNAMLATVGMMTNPEDKSSARAYAVAMDKLISRPKKELMHIVGTGVFAMVQLNLDNDGDE